MSPRNITKKVYPLFRYATCVSDPAWAFLVTPFHDPEQNCLQQRPTGVSAQHVV